MWAEWFIGWAVIENSFYFKKGSKENNTAGLLPLRVSKLPVKCEHALQLFLQHRTSIVKNYFTVSFLKVNNLCEI